jgi:hypothetical protein
MTQDGEAAVGLRGDIGVDGQLCRSDRHDADS